MDGDLTGLRVVGVVGDVRELSPESLPGPMVYVNARQRPAVTSSFSVIARGPGMSAIAEPVRRIMRDLLPDSPYDGPRERRLRPAPSVSAAICG